MACRRLRFSNRCRSPLSEENRPQIATLPPRKSKGWEFVPDGPFVGLELTTAPLCYETPVYCHATQLDINLVRD